MALELLFPGTRLESDSVLAKPREGIVLRRSSSPRVPFANARLRPTRLAATLLDSLSASARRRSRRSCPPSFRTMDGFASRRNCSSSSALRLAAIVIRKAANCSLEKRESKRCPQRRVLRRPWAVALVMLVVSAVARAQAQTKPSVSDGHRRVEPSRPPQPASQSSPRPMCPLRASLLAQRPRHHATRVRLGRDRRSRRLRRHERRT